MDSPSVAHKQARLLQWLAGRGTPGSKIKIKMADDWPVAECCNSEEFHYHCVELTRRNFVVGKATTECFLAMLSTEGWRELEIRNHELVDDDRIFVAMSLNKSLDNAFKKGFKVGIEAAGYQAYRVDQALHLERIDLKIIGDLRRSRVIVADVTDERPNVYFEAGFAMALNKPVIWSVREDQKDKLHFDTRQFPHLIWKDPGGLAMQIEDLIAGTVGRRARELV